MGLDSHQVPYSGRGKLDHFRKGCKGSHSRRRLRGTSLLARGRTRDEHLITRLARHLRQRLGPRLAGIVADCRFTSHASIVAVLESGVPFILLIRRTAGSAA